MTESQISLNPIFLPANHLLTVPDLFSNPSGYTLARYTTMTPSQAETSRINGAKSRGPKTEQGRRAVSLNAVKHGLSAETVVLPGESEAEYEAELQEYLRHFAPASKPEADLVRQLASAHWRVARFTHIETSLLSLEIERQRDRVTADWNQIEQCARLALAFEALAGQHSPLALLNRYQARLHHEYQRLLKALLQLQATRATAAAKLQNEPKQPAIQPAAAPANDEPKTTEPKIKRLEIGPLEDLPPGQAAAIHPAYRDSGCAARY